ncbi:hypothetical protein CPC08DRAFT_771025 [Agrocybe pediades]|nr:hypothetical protein CPC08DRAFT_771025 [Agrocybe pediades]
MSQRLLLDRSMSQCTIKKRMPDDLSRYKEDFDLFVDFVSRMEQSIRNADLLYERLADRGLQISDSAYLNTVTLYYTGRMSNSPQLIPNIEEIIPQDNIFRSTFYPVLLNSIAYSLEHPQHPKQTPHEALALFIDRWAASIIHQGMGIPNAYCLVEALDVDEIPNFYGNTPNMGRSKPVKTDGEKIAERLFRRAVFYPRGGGVVPPAIVHTRPVDHCGEALAWGYIRWYVDKYLVSGRNRQLVITSLTMGPDKIPADFCPDCVERAWDMVRTYPGLRIVDLGSHTQTPTVYF